VPWRDWIRTVEVEPSIYAANFAILGEQIEDLCRCGCRIFHFDVGDGHFVEPITMGPIVLKDLAPIVHRYEGRIDVHMMVEEPLKHASPLAAAGADSVTFHYEAVDDVSATVRALREHDLQVGVAFTPDSEPEDVAAAAGDADFVLCMSIYPGYSGQPFREDTYERVRRLRAALDDRIYIQVDGGVTQENIRQLYDEGVRLLVAGSAIFEREDLPRAYRRLVQALA
jgi:ribulose-phosphate 3-epimerase